MIGSCINGVVQPVITWRQGRVCQYMDTGYHANLQLKAQLPGTRLYSCPAYLQPSKFVAALTLGWSIDPELLMTALFYLVT